MTREPRNQSFYNLRPDNILTAIDRLGFQTTGQYSQLNSYENRVFDVCLEPNSNNELSDRVITKFYRPLRWTEKAILQEHEYIFDLLNEGLTVIPPLKIQGTTLHKFENINFCLYKKFWGRMPQELFDEDYFQIGRTLAQMHNIGEQKEAKGRPYFLVENYGWQSLDHMNDFLELDVRTRYIKAAEEIFDYLESELDPKRYIRIHGDCHKGNLLLDDQPNKSPQFFFVDFDDVCNGPEVQDFWMLLSSSQDYNDELDLILSGYDELREVPEQDLHLIPALRGLRIIYYSGWIAKRWQDPTFPHIFPLYKTYDYWLDEVQMLEDILEYF